MRGWVMGLALVVAVPGWAGAQSELADPDPPEALDPPEPPLPLILREASRPRPMTELQLRTHLEVHAAAMRRGDQAGAELALGLFEEAKEALGSRNEVLAASLLLAEAKAARRGGELEVALARAERAVQLAPDLLAARWVELELLVDLDATRVARIARAGFGLLAAWGRGIRNQVHLVTVLGAALFLGAAAAIALLAVAMLVRHLRCLASELARGLPAVLGPGEVGLGALVLVLLPGLLGLGWPASVALALGFTLPWQSSRERVLCGAGLLLVSASPWLAGMAAPLVAFHGSRVDVQAAVLDEALADRSERQLDHLSREDPSDTFSALVLGLRAARRSDLLLARRLLERTTRSDPSDPVAGNALALVEYRLGERDVAERRLAAVLDQGRAEPHLNLALLLTDRDDFEGAEREIRKARDLDPEATERMLARAGLPVGSRLSWMSVETSRLWTELYQLDEGQVGATRAALRGRVAGPVHDLVLPGIAALAVFFGLLGFMLPHRSRPCERCGEMAEPQPTGGLCSQCQSVFLVGRLVSPDSRLRKERQVRSHGRRQRLLQIGSSFVPGLEWVVSGRAPVLGFVAVASFCALAGLAWVLSAGGLGLNAWSGPADVFAGRSAASAIAAVGVLAMAGTFLLAVRR